VSEQKLQDEQLAMLTDQLLAQEAVEVPAEWAKEAEVIRHLQRATASESVPPEFRQRLTRRLYDEWDRTHEQTPKRRKVVPLRRQLLWVAASVLVLLVGGVLIFNNTSPDGDSIGGTSALGAAEGLLVLAMFLITVGIAYLMIWARRR
jgi:hypothetical protein